MVNCRPSPTPHRCLTSLEVLPRGGDSAAAYRRLFFSDDCGCYPYRGQLVAKE